MGLSVILNFKCVGGIGGGGDKIGVALVGMCTFEN